VKKGRRGEGGEGDTTSAFTFIFSTTESGEQTTERREQNKESRGQIVNNSKSKFKSADCGG
jgi:hypothetical protein